MTVKELASKMVTGCFYITVRYLYNGSTVEDASLTVEQFEHDYMNEKIAYIVNENGQLVIGLE